VKADARGYQFLLDYQGPATHFRSCSLADLLSGKVPPGAFSDKIVLIGVTAQSVKDFFFTPYSRGFSEEQQVPGVILHGLMISQFLRAGMEGVQPLATLTEKQEMLWILLCCLLGGILGSGPTRPGVFPSSVLPAFCSSVSLPIRPFSTGGGFLCPPALAFVLSAALVTAYLTSLERKQRSLLNADLFQTRLKEVAESLWRQREQFLRNGRPRSQKLVMTPFLGPEGIHYGFGEDGPSGSHGLAQYLHGKDDRNHYGSRGYH